MFISIIYSSVHFDIHLEILQAVLHQLCNMNTNTAFHSPPQTPQFAFPWDVHPLKQLQMNF